MLTWQLVKRMKYSFDLQYGDDLNCILQFGSDAGWESDSLEDDVISEVSVDDNKKDRYKQTSKYSKHWATDKGIMYFIERSCI